MHEVFWFGLNKMISWWGIAPFSIWEAKAQRLGSETTCWRWSTYLGCQDLDFLAFGIRLYYVCAKHSWLGSWLRIGNFTKSDPELHGAARKRDNARSSSTCTIALRDLGFLSSLSLQWGTTPLRKNHIHISKQEIRNLRAWCHVVHFATQWGSPMGSWNAVPFSSH